MNQTQKNMLALAIVLVVAVGVASYLLRGSAMVLDQAYANRFAEHLKAHGLEASKTAFDEDGRMTVYTLTPPVEGGSTYVIETAFYPGKVTSWARTHGESRTPIDAPHTDEVASSDYTEATGETARTHRNCPEKVWAKLFEYFDAIKDAAKKAAEGQ